MINVDKNELRNRTNCTNAHLINLIRPFANEVLSKTFHFSLRMLHILRINHENIYLFEGLSQNISCLGRDVACVS